MHDNTNYKFTLRFGASLGLTPDGKGSCQNLYLHQQLHKTNILVQCFNGFHFFFCEREIKYLEKIID